MPRPPIEIPGVGPVEFPDEMTDAQVNAAATRLYQGANPKAKQPPVKTWADTAVDALPAAGAIVGGALGAASGIPTLGLTSVPAAAVGAGILGAGGEAAKQLINRMRGAEAPATSGEAATAIGREGAIDAAGTAVLGAGAKMLPGMAPALGKGATAAGKALEAAADSPRMARLSEGGALLAAVMHGDLREAGLSLAAPYLAKGAGYTLKALGSKLAGVGMKAAEDTLPADIQMMRNAISKGWSLPNALRVVSDGDADYAKKLSAGLLDSIKKQGVPAPESVNRLMASPSFSKLPQP